MNAAKLLKALLRRLFLAGVLIGLIGSVGLWIASYCSEYGFGISWESPRSLYLFAAAGGSFRVLRHSHVGNPSPPEEVRWQAGAMNSEAVMWVGPQNFAPQHTWFDWSEWWFTLHFGWIVVPLGLILAVYFLPAFRRRRRRRLGLCASCGYDLRGLLDARCPECGETFERPSPLSKFSHT